METLKNTVKGAVLLGIIGIVLAIAAEPVAVVLGGKAVLGEAGMIAAQSYTGAALFSGIFFAGFGALTGLLTPTCDQLFDQCVSQAATTTPAHKQQHDLTVNEMSPKTHEVAETKTSYVQSLAAERARAAQSQLVR